MTTPWTPVLIPVDNLPPNVEPELVEPHYKRNGEVIRTTALRRSEAVCLDPDCPLMWSGPESFAAANGHASNTGHLIRQYYTAEYTVQINPHHPKHRGRVKITLVDREVSPEEHALIGDRHLPTREAATNQDIDARIRKGARIAQQTGQPSTRPVRTPRPPKRKSDGNVHE